MREQLLNNLANEIEELMWDVDQTEYRDCFGSRDECVRGVKEMLVNKDLDDFLAWFVILVLASHNDLGMLRRLDYINHLLADYMGVELA